MLDRRFELYLNQAFGWDRFDVTFRQTGFMDGTKQIAFATAIELKSHEPGGIVAPCGRITEADAQQWIDELWRAGVRPTEGTGSAGAMGAVQRHLEDMRRLVFKGKP